MELHFTRDAAVARRGALLPCRNGRLGRGESSRLSVSGVRRRGAVQHVRGDHPDVLLDVPDVLLHVVEVLLVMPACASRFSERTSSMRRYRSRARYITPASAIPGIWNTDSGEVECSSGA